jgi:signal transduction histidine kinase
MIEINKQPFDFSTIFEETCETGWYKHKQPGVKYVVENPYESLIVDIDASNLRQVIQQVAANAAQYTHSGTVRARYDYIGRKLMISIEDTGEGITAEDLKRIYERFMSRSQNGSGLGLSISKELTEQMGGTLEINSDAGLGTTVWITIPCQATEIKRRKFL